VSVLVLRVCALKLIFKLISGKECIADCVPSFELVRRRKYSELAIFTTTVAVKIASQLFLRIAVKIALAFTKWSSNAWTTCNVCCLNLSVGIWSTRHTYFSVTR